MQRRDLDDRQAFCPLAHTLFNQAVCYRQAGNLPRAAALLDSVMPRFAERGDIAGCAAAHNELGRIAFEQGRYPEAIDHLRASLQGYSDLGERVSVADVMQNWAAVMAGEGNPALAAGILSAVEAAYTTMGHPLPPGPQKIFAADVAWVRQSLDPDVFAARWAAGQNMQLDGIIAEVLAQPPSL